MNKNLKLTAAALSIAGLASAGAHAAAVKAYGVVDVGLAFVSSDADAAGSSRTNTFSMETAREFGSRFGLRGSEDLGDGLRIDWVLESGFRADDGTFDQTGKFFGRESHIDLTGPFGKVSAGLMPIFGSTLGADGLFRAIDPLFANYTQAFGSGQVTASSWTRVDNAVSFVSPTFAGFTGYAMYAFKKAASDAGDEGRGGDTDRYASIAARWQAGALETVVVADTTMYGSARTGEKAFTDDGWTVTVGGNYTFSGGARLLAFTQLFGGQELAVHRAGVGRTGLTLLTAGQPAAGYGFVDGFGASLGVNVPAMSGVAKAAVAYRDMDNRYGTDFRRVCLSAGYDYAITKRTAVYAMTGWSREKIETTGGVEGAPNGYELTCGVVHRF